MTPTPIPLPKMSSPCAVLLGVAQDGGYPQPGCRQPCCQAVRDQEREPALPVAAGLVDPAEETAWLLDATPALPQQLELLASTCGFTPGLGGILLTHAHMGHYPGLLYLGREAMATRRLPVFVMPRMRTFLEEHLPWRQLVQRGHIELHPLATDQPVSLGPRLRVTALRVPHRGEISETVGFRVEGPGAALLYLPDIDGWDGWEPGLEQALASVDAAWIDGTFYRASELSHRRVDEVPHPTVSTTLTRLAGLPAPTRQKVRFIHLNHTNPLLDPHSRERRHVRAQGCGIGVPGLTVEL